MPALISNELQAEYIMKYLIKAKLIPENRSALFEEIKNETLGTGSVAFGEYVKNMHQARELEDGTVCWVEVCFCATPLNEERQYWEKYFNQIVIENALDPRECRDANGDEHHACLECSCTQELDDEMLNWGKPFIR